MKFASSRSNRTMLNPLSPKALLQAMSSYPSFLNNSAMIYVGIWSAESSAGVAGLENAWVVGQFEP